MSKQSEPESIGFLLAQVCRLDTPERTNYWKGSACIAGSIAHCALCGSRMILQFLDTAFGSPYVAYELPHIPNLLAT